MITGENLKWKKKKKMRYDIGKFDILSFVWLVRKFEFEGEKEGKAE